MVRRTRVCGLYLDERVDEDENTAEREGERRKGSLNTGRSTTMEVMRILRRTRSQTSP